MEQFPGNQKRLTRDQEAPQKPEKEVRRVVNGEVVRRKTPLGRRIVQNLIGGDVQSVWGWMFGEVLVPAAQDMVIDAVKGGVERMVVGDSYASRGRRGTRYGGIPNHTPYNRYAPAPRESRSDSRRDSVRRNRGSHSLDEIIVPNRVDAEEVLDRLEDFCERFEVATVMDLYGLVGIPATYVDQKWGWTDLRDATVSRAGREGYLLNLPRPQALD